jgi:hypothetical protein
MPIVCCGHKVYYQVMYRRPKSTVGNFSLCYCVGCFEDIRDAVSKIVSFYQWQPDSDGQIGIVRTSIKDAKKFVPSSYEQN